MNIAPGYHGLDLIFDVMWWMEEMRLAYDVCMNCPLVFCIPPIDSQTISYWAELIPLTVFDSRE